MSNTPKPWRSERSMNVCIVAHNAWGAMAGGHEGHIGGVERQTSVFARWLAQRGHTVHLLTWDEGQGRQCYRDGVEVIPICRRDAGFPGMRFLHPRWSGLLRAMRRADAQVYYQNGAEYVTGQVALWCRQHRKGFVYSVASDPDCDPTLPRMKSIRERLLYRVGLRLADRVVVQTGAQQRALLAGFGVDALALPMPLTTQSSPRAIGENHDTPQPFLVLWVGRICPVKRLELLLDVATMRPQMAFEVVGTPDPINEYTRSLLARAQTLPNVVHRGRVPFDEMPDVYRRATVLCCTSAYEGFPNTFLEAWSHGIPIVTTIDPDRVVERHRLGLVAATPSAIAESLARMRTSTALRNEFSGNARRYVAAFHVPEIALPRFETVLQAACRRGRPSTP